MSRRTRSRAPNEPKPSVQFNDEVDAHEANSSVAGSGEDDNDRRPTLGDEMEVSEDEDHKPSDSPYRSALNQLNQMKAREMDDIPGHTPYRRRPLRDEPKEKPKDNRNGSNWCFFLFFVFGVVLALTAGYNLYDGGRFWRAASEATLANPWLTFEEEFTVFEQNYSQVFPQIGFRVLKSAVRNVMLSHGKIAPAVILMIASQNNENVLRTAERDFVNIVNKAYNERDFVVIDGKQTDSRDIADKFEQNFGSGRRHTIVIENVEAVRAQEVMSLHQFTDHENAKYNRIIIIMTAVHHKKVNLSRAAKLQEMDEVATSLFQIKWKNEMREEQQFPLISRLTPSVVTIID